MDEQKEAGVPSSVSIENQFQGCSTTQLLSDNYAGCVDLGKYFVEKVGMQAKYVELLGLVGDKQHLESLQRLSFGRGSVRRTGDGCATECDFDRSKAMEVWSLCCNRTMIWMPFSVANDSMAMGAYQALLAAGKANKVRVFGYDGSEDVIKSINEKKIAATVMQYPKLIAKTAAEYAHD